MTSVDPDDVGSFDAARAAGAEPTTAPASSASGNPRPTTASPATRPALLILAATILSQALWILTSIDRPLQLADEPREAAIALEMARSGDWLVPRLNGEPFVEKPPLMYILASLVVRAAGSTNQAWLRVPIALAAVTTLVFVFLIGRRMGLLAAAASVSLLASTNLFLSDSIMLRVDPCLMAFLTAAIFMTIEWWLAQRRATRLLWAVLAAACLGLAVSTKGPVAILLHGAAVALLVLFDPRRSVGRVLGLAAIWLAALVPLGLWALALRDAGGNALVQEALLRNSWGRFSQADLGHDRPFWYYLRAMPLELTPWILFVIAGCVAALPSLRRTSAGRDASESATVKRVALSWAVVSLALLSASAAKRALYLLPIGPAWCLLGGWWFATTMEQSFAPLTRAQRWLVGLTAWTVGAACLFFGIRGLIDPDDPHRSMALLAALPAGLSAWLLWRHRLFAHPRTFMPMLLVVGQLAVITIAPALLWRAQLADETVDEAREALQREAATATRVVTFQLGERGLSVVSLALAKAVDDLEDPAHLSFDEHTSSVLLIADNQTSGVALSDLAQHAHIAEVVRAPMGRQSLLLYRLSPKGP